MKHNRLINFRKGLILILMVTSSTLLAQKKQKSYKSFDEIKRLISLKQRDEAVLLCLSILEKKTYLL